MAGSNVSTQLLSLLLYIVITCGLSFHISPKWSMGRSLAVLTRRGAVGAKDVDHNMIPTYETLAHYAVDNVLPTLSPDKQWFCAVAGGPGSGKSTLCEKVAQLVNKLTDSETAVVVPMDGYHFSKKQLIELDPPHASSLLPRRGSPPTFDPQTLYDDLSEAQRLHSKQFPTYSRVLSDPIPGGVRLLKSHRIVFVEGNYLLLGHLKESQESETIRQEAAKWAPLLSLFDEKWFIGPKGSDSGDGVLEQRRRLIQRHLETWTESKTIMWEAKTAEEGAAKRTDFNDVPNAYLVDKTRPFADRNIISL